MAITPISAQTGNSSFEEYLLRYGDSKKTNTLYGRPLPQINPMMANIGGGATAGLIAGQASARAETLTEGGISLGQGVAGGVIGGSAFGPPGMVAGGIAGGVTSLLNSYISVTQARRQRRDQEKQLREVKLLHQQAMRQARADQAYERAWQETLRQDSLDAAKEAVAYREGETEWQHEQRTKEFLASEEGRKWSQDFQEKQFASQQADTEWQKGESAKDRAERNSDRQYSRGQQALQNRWQALKYAQDRMSQLVSTNQNLKDRMIAMAR